MSFQIDPVKSTHDLADVVRLFRLYAASLDIDLAYQNFESEMAAMPGLYAPPNGELLLAKDLQGVAVGAVGLRPIGPSGCCEMKRLYVTPEGRHLGVGRALVEALIEAARRIGYKEMRLDTLQAMTAAQALYHRLGFDTTDPYYETPISGTVFMRLRLSAEQGLLDCRDR